MDRHAPIDGGNALVNVGDQTADGDFLFRGGISRIAHSLTHHQVWRRRRRADVMWAHRHDHERIWRGRNP